MYKSVRKRSREVKEDFQLTVRGHVKAFRTFMCYSQEKSTIDGRITHRITLGHKGRVGLCG